MTPSHPFTLTIQDRTFRLIPYGQGGVILDGTTKQVLRHTGSREEWHKWLSNAVRVSAGMAAK